MNDFKIGDVVELIESKRRTLPNGSIGVVVRVGSGRLSVEFDRQIVTYYERRFKQYAPNPMKDFFALANKQYN